MVYPKLDDITAPILDPAELQPVVKVTFDLLAAAEIFFFLKEKKKKKPACLSSLYPRQVSRV